MRWFLPRVRECAIREAAATRFQQIWQQINVCIKELASSPDDIKMPPANTARQFSPREWDGIFLSLCPAPISPPAIYTRISKEFWLYFLAFIRPGTTPGLYLIKRNYTPARASVRNSFSVVFHRRCSVPCVLDNNASSNFAYFPTNGRS